MSGARLAVAVGVVIVALGLAAGLAVLRSRWGMPAEQSTATPATATAQVPSDRPVPPPEPAPPRADTPADAAAPDSLLAELNQALPGLGVGRPARLVAAAAQRDRLTLTFNAEFRPQLADLSALDELIAALSAHAQARGYRHLTLRMLDERGRSLSIDELTATPAARRPRPEPIDDGVRR